MPKNDAGRQPRGRHRRATSSALEIAANGWRPDLGR